MTFLYTYPEFKSHLIEEKREGANDMNTIMKKSSSIENLMPDLFTAWKSIDNAVRDKDGYNFKYADDVQITEIIRKALIPCHLVFMQFIGPISEGKVSLESVLLHTSGEYISCVSETHLDSNQKNNVQAAGSAITYLRRKTKIAFFCISEEDETDSSGVDSNKYTKTPRKPTESHNVHTNLIETIRATINPKSWLNYILEQDKVGSVNEINPKRAEEWIKFIESKKDKSQ